MGSKRKRHHHHSSNGRARDHQSSGGDGKRRRLSGEVGNPDVKETNSSSKDRHVNETHHHASVEEGEDENGWTKVLSKNSRSNKDNNHRRDEYPRLNIYSNYQSDVRIKDLRDLSLYVLADEVAPKWVAIGNSRQVSKVVVVMVPGLDERLLQRVQGLAGHGLEATDQDQLGGWSRDGDSSRTVKDVEESGERTVLANDDADGPSTIHDQPEDPSQGDSPKAQDTDNTNTSFKPATDTDRSSAIQDPPNWLFQNLLQVKGPGDAKMSRVHSPLQAMLLAPEPDQRKSQGGVNGSGFVGDRTPITEFVHSADDLRDAEFPIHPASFTAQVDAELEASRREQTKQSVNHGWVDTKVTSSQPAIDPTSHDAVSRGLSIYSIDCEMVQTSDGATALARVSVISYPDGAVIMDKYVKPDLPISNYFTQYSGITPEILENVTTKLADVQNDLAHLLNPTSVLLGHSLDSDLNALQMTHPFLVDTSLIYPHPRGLPLRSSLKFLANKYLKREIQTAGARGHNSVEDAQAVLDLVKLKCERGPKWGTIEANGEPIFRRLKRNGRTTAIVEYGTPERGFGKDATFPIGCQNDDDVVQGVLRAVKGDDYFDFQIPAGGVDFVWGRLRAIEYARGWVSGGVLVKERVEAKQQPPQTQQNGKEDAAVDERTRASTKLALSRNGGKEDVAADENTEEIDSIALETVRRLERIHDALPPKALLIVFSGTGDVRPVMRLQAQQQQYKKEFKVKKWDDLTVKWTDVEEQALRKACDEARAGWGVCTIK